MRREGHGGSAFSVPDTTALVPEASEQRPSKNYRTEDSRGADLVYLPAAAEGNLSRLPELARMLAQQRVDVIIAVGIPAARAAMTAAPNTPVVLSFSGDDPVKEGLAVSLARPGGSVTGIFFRGIETDAKRLELLSEALPAARVFGFLAAPTLEPERSEGLARTAAKLGVSLKTIVVQSPADYASAFEAFRAEGAAGVLVMGTNLFVSDAPSFSRLATERGMATICEWEFMARAGCMLGFGPDLVGLRRLTGDYVARKFQWCESCRNTDPIAGPLYADCKPPHRCSTEPATFHRLSRPCRRGGERIGHFHYWQILLQKSFRGRGLKFSEP